MGCCVSLGSIFFVNNLLIILLSVAFSSAAIYDFVFFQRYSFKKKLKNNFQLLHRHCATFQSFTSLPFLQFFFGFEFLGI